MQTMTQYLCLCLQSRWSLLLPAANTSANLCTDSDGSDTGHTRPQNTNPSTNRFSKQTKLSYKTKPALRSHNKRSSAKQGCSRGARYTTNTSGSPPSSPPHPHPSHHMSSPTDDRRTKTRLLMESRSKESHTKPITPTVQVYT